MRYTGTLSVYKGMIGMMVKYAVSTRQSSFSLVEKESCCHKVHDLRFGRFLDDPNRNLTFPGPLRHFPRSEASPCGMTMVWLP